MLDKLRNIFQVPELKRRILFTLGLFVVYRLGEHTPTPGVNATALAGAFESQRNTLFGLYDFFVGGAFSRATVFALGIMPYISSSIILLWLGEKITEHGIGNGISLIIFLNIVGRMPNSLFAAYDSFRAGTMSLLMVIAFAVLATAVVALVVLMTQGQRKIPVQYAKRIVG